MGSHLRLSVWRQIAHVRRKSTTCSWRIPNTIISVLSSMREFWQLAVSDRKDSSTCGLSDNMMDEAVVKKKWSFLFSVASASACLHSAPPAPRQSTHCVSAAVTSSSIPCSSLSQPRTNLSLDTFEQIHRISGTSRQARRRLTVPSPLVFAR